MRSSERSFVTVHTGYGREDELTGRSLGAGVNYVTDKGSLVGVRVSHTDVNGVRYDTQTTSTTRTDVSTNRVSTDMGTRTEDVGNIRNTIQTTKHTDTTTTTTQTDTTTVEYGRHGSKTNAFSIYAEPNTGNTRPFAELGYTNRKFDDNAREQYGTGTLGIRHHTANGNFGAEISQNFGDNKTTGYNFFAEHKVNNRVSFTVSAGKNTEVGNHVSGQVRLIFGGNDGYTALAVPTTASAYMARDIHKTTITDIAPANLMDKTKYFQNSTTTSQIASSWNIQESTEEKVINQEILYHPVSDAEIQEYLNRVKPLMDQLKDPNDRKIHNTYSINLEGLPK